MFIVDGYKNTVELFTQSSSMVEMFCFFYSMNGHQRFKKHLIIVGNRGSGEDKSILLCFLRKVVLVEIFFK